VRYAPALPGGVKDSRRLPAVLPNAFIAPLGMVSEVRLPFASC